MEGLQAIQEYINRTSMKNADAYCMCVKELRALRSLGEQDPYTALCLAYAFGQAKGYRYAKKEAQE